VASGVPIHNFIIVLVHFCGSLLYVMTKWQIEREGSRERRGGVHIHWYKCKWTTTPVEICLSPIISPSAHLLEPSSPVPTYYLLTHLLAYYWVLTQDNKQERKREVYTSQQKRCRSIMYSPLYYWDSKKWRVVLHFSIPTLLTCTLFYVFTHFIYYPLHYFLSLYWPLHTKARILLCLDSL
jgi:hypothetical protein